MKYLTTGTLALLVAVGLLTVAAWSQPPGGPWGMQRGRGGGQGRGGPQGQQSGQQPSTHMLIMALNANGDEEISATEIRKAASSLRKLDRNRDGKLTVDELMPSGPPPFAGPGQGEFGGQRQGGGGEGRGPQHGGFEQGGGPGGPGHGGFGGPGQGGPGGGLVEQLMGFDADEDGKVTKDELSEGVESAFEKGDLDKDGAIDKEEAEKLVEELGPPHGGRGDRGNRGDEARGERPVGEERPQRPR
jgi:EF hand